MKIYLHVGAEKTGTSAIQHLLFKNKSALKQQGYAYLHQKGRVEYRDFPAVCMNLKRKDPYFFLSNVSTQEERKEFNQAFRKRLSKQFESLPEDTKAVIISSEHFSSRLRQLPEIRKVKNLLSKYSEDITVVFYLREQSQRVVSQYSTRIKSGGTDTPTQYITRYFQNPSLNYDSILGLWEQVFGQANIIVRVYDEREFYRGSLFEDFTRIVDSNLSSHLDLTMGRANPSLNRSGLRLARLINTIVPINNSRRSRFRKLNKFLMVLVPYVTFGKALTLDRESEERIRQRFKESNENVRIRYFPSRDKLFQSTDGKT